MSTAAAGHEVGQLVDHLFRNRAGQMVAYLTRLLGSKRLDLAEEVVQEALLKALRHWPYSGIPENPAGWLFRVARNAALDAVRRDALAGEHDETTNRLIHKLLRLGFVRKVDYGQYQKVGLNGSGRLFDVNVVESVK